MGRWIATGLIFAAVIYALFAALVMVCGCYLARGIR